jgi:hypothetical protein
MAINALVSYSVAQNIEGYSTTLIPIAVACSLANLFFSFLNERDQKMLRNTILRGALESEMVAQKKLDVEMEKRKDFEKAQEQKKDAEDGQQKPLV